MILYTNILYIYTYLWEREREIFTNNTDEVTYFPALIYTEDQGTHIILLTVFLLIYAPH